MNNQTNIEKNDLVSWFSESIIIKVGLIGFLTILLLIPSNLIQELVSERQTRQLEITKEITDKWSSKQLIEGPVLVLPHKKLIGNKDAAGKTVYKEIISNIYILPELLNVKSSVTPQILHRGIFGAVVYDSKVNVNGKFSELEIEKSGVDPEMILWDKAKVVIGISDLKGMKNNPEIKLSEKTYQVEPDFTSLKLFTNNLIILPDLSEGKRTSLNFSFNLDLRGSDELSFLPLGKSTLVSVNGKWKDPSFIGRYLPEERTINENGFSANWKMPYFNRPFPQQWEEVNSVLKTDDKASFGVKFMLPVDQYQKTMRTAKYSFLIILLTFISLLFTEMIQNKKVHLLQYVLIGAAMIIYYTLLLSFSEQVGFNYAYLIASVCTIVLIGLFMASLLKNKKAALILSSILSIFYGFIFIIIQLQDLALLYGSIGLFIIVATIMYLSSKIDWSKKQSAKE
jgi:inner membrane protein